MDNCKEPVVAVWAESTNPTDRWPLCEQHQESEFGGWPEGVEPPETESDDDKEETGKGGKDEVWTITKVVSIGDLTDCPVKCSTETCALPAACVYVSSAAPTKKWYSCLDCQVSLAFPRAAARVHCSTFSNLVLPTRYSPRTLVDGPMTSLSSLSST
jgi:hypothetical protein